MCFWFWHELFHQGLQSLGNWVCPFPHLRIIVFFFVFLHRKILKYISETPVTHRRTLNIAFYCLLVPFAVRCYMLFRKSLGNLRLLKSVQYAQLLPGFSLYSVVLLPWSLICSLPHDTLKSLCSQLQYRGGICAWKSKKFRRRFGVGTSSGAAEDQRAVCHHPHEGRTHQGAGQNR